MINVTSVSLIDADSVFRRSYNTHCDLIIPSYFSCICSLISCRFPKGARHPNQLDVTNRHLLNPCNPSGPNGKKCNASPELRLPPQCEGSHQELIRSLRRHGQRAVNQHILCGGTTPPLRKQFFLANTILENRRPSPRDISVGILL